MPRLTPIAKEKYEKFLTFIGCKLKRKKGDHFIYDRPGLKRPVVHTADKEVSINVIMSNLRTLEMSREEYFEILKKI